MDGWQRPQTQLVNTTKMSIFLLLTAPLSSVVTGWRCVHLLFFLTLALFSCFPTHSCTSNCFSLSLAFLVPAFPASLLSTQRHNQQRQHRQDKTTFLLSDLICSHTHQPISPLQGTASFSRLTVLAIHPFFQRQAVGHSNNHIFAFQIPFNMEPNGDDMRVQKSNPATSDRSVASSSSFYSFFGDQRVDALLLTMVLTLVTLTMMTADLDCIWLSL